MLNFYKVLGIFIIGILSFGKVAIVSAQPINDAKCNAISLGTLVAGTPSTVSGTTVAATDDPSVTTSNPSSDLVFNDGRYNGVWYSFQVPPGYSNALVTLTPTTGTVSFTLGYFLAPCTTNNNPIFNAAVNASSPGATIQTQDPDNCFFNNSVIFPAPSNSIYIRVGTTATSPEGTFNLSITLLDPNCDDNCLNGNEYDNPAGASEVIYQPTVDALSATEFCDGDDVIIEGSHDANFISTISYNWSPNGETNTFITATESGDYQLEISDEFGCVSYSDIVTVQVNSLPTPTVTATGSTTANAACANSTGNTYSTPAIAGHSYSWAVTGGTIVGSTTSNTVTVQWGTGTSGTLAVTETDNNFSTGCSNISSTYNVTIHPNPTPTITAVSPTVNNSACANSTGNTYSTPSVAGHTYVWTITGGTITSGSGTNAVTVTWGSAGTGTLTVTETDNTVTPSCVATSTTYNVTINANPAPTITNVSGTPANTACAGIGGYQYSTPLLGDTHIHGLLQAVRFQVALVLIRSQSNGEPEVRVHLQ